MSKQLQHDQEAQYDIGDVETTKIVKPTTENGNKVIEGLSGRKLIINDKWSNPSDEYRVGLKRAYELFPKDLTSRIKSVRRYKFEYVGIHVCIGTPRKLRKEASPITL